MSARFVALVLLIAAPAAAQSRDERPAHRLEASLGGFWIGGASMGELDAELRANQVPAGPFTLFTTSSRMAAAPGFDGRLAFWLTRSLAVEAGFSFTQPELRTRIADDIEDAPDLTVSERIDQYVIDVSAVWLIDALTIGRRAVPFVSGGAGYLRQLHEGRTLVETGQAYNVGGGLRYWLLLRDAGFVRALGVRADARLYVLVNGIQLEDRPRSHGALSGSVFFTF